MNNRILLNIFLVSYILLSLSCNPTDKSDSGQDSKEPASQFVLISTDFGDMKVLLYDSTPVHRDNFLKLVKEQYYEGLLFHRLIPQFMFQGGDPESKNAAPSDLLGMGELGYQLPAELNKGIHKKGALAAARIPDQVNPQRESSACQFFIVHGVLNNPDGELALTDELLAMIEQRSNIQYTAEEKKIYQTLGGRPDLDGQYTVFGEVVEGLDVIDKIAQQPTGEADRPLTDIKMSIKIWKE